MSQVDDIYVNRMRDRVGMYFSTWISHLADNEFIVTPRCASWNNTSYENGLGANILTGAKIVTAPVWKRVVQGKAKAEGSAHEKEMEAFYKFQKEGMYAFWPVVVHLISNLMAVMHHLNPSLYSPNTGYDNFRENFLHARSDLIEAMPVKAKGNMVWIDVGGGTARNLEFLPVSGLLV